MSIFAKASYWKPGVMFVLAMCVSTRLCAVPGLCDCCVCDLCVIVVSVTCVCDLCAAGFAGTWRRWRHSRPTRRCPAVRPRTAPSNSGGTMTWSCTPTNRYGTAGRAANRAYTEGAANKMAIRKAAATRVLLITLVNSQKRIRYVNI